VRAIYLPSPRCTPDDSGCPTHRTARICGVNHSLTRCGLRPRRVLHALNHECVIKLYEAIETPRRIYLVMQYAAGGSLLDYVRSRKRLPEAEAVQMLQQVGNCHLMAPIFLHRCYGSAQLPSGSLTSTPPRRRNHRGFSQIIDVHGGACCSTPVST
jgi:hypothetical protein